MMRPRTGPLVATALAFAFAAADAQWQAGAKVGFGQSGFSGSSEFNWNSGPSSGAFLAFALAPAAALQLELDPVSKVGVSHLAADELTLSAHYLNVPLFLQLKLPTPSGVNPYVSAGPVMSLRLDCSLQFVGGGVQTNDSCEGSGRPKTTPVTFGVGANVGLERDYGILDFLIEGRATTGLSIETVPIDARRPRSYGWAVLSGVSFPLGRSRTATPIGPRPMSPVAATPTSAAVAAPTMPELPAVTVATAAPVTAPPTPQDALDVIPSTRLVSVTATDADVRALLVLIAREGGVSIVVDPDVTGRISLSLTNVPVVDALRAVIEAAHLTVAGTAGSAPEPAIVFYQLPVNVNTAPASAIAKRFGVSDELARWLAENQHKTP